MFLIIVSSKLTIRNTINDNILLRYIIVLIYISIIDIKNLESIMKVQMSGSISTETIAEFPPLFQWRVFV